MAILWKGSPSLGLAEMEPGPLTAAVLGTGEVLYLNASPEC